ncbi:NADH dehydrogenase [ubiquinone] 1 alpha subcomplex subunit 8-B [Scenedesmus sp. PABB004]|nr:NADH dehydrogenase [ubiquinone] 1 alpha subcomplex subunit 8-B [Scenedesmus sp. PABB004]
MAQVEGVKHADLQAVAFHMLSKCAEQTAAFEECYANNASASKCAEEFKAVAACAKDLVAEAAAAAKEEWHHYTACLDMMGGKYSYCRPEKAAFDTAFPLE